MLYYMLYTTLYFNRTNTSMYLPFLFKHLHSFRKSLIVCGIKKLIFIKHNHYVRMLYFYNHVYFLSKTLKNWVLHAYQLLVLHEVKKINALRQVFHSVTLWSLTMTPVKVKHKFSFLDSDS